MARPGTVPLLLLLLTSVLAVQYHGLDTVSLPGPAVRTVPAPSVAVCALHCEYMPPLQCSGFHYEISNGMCHLFSADCRGPAADSSQLTTVHYMARNTCPGSASNRCECPSGFGRYGSRCLQLLSPGELSQLNATSRCAALDAHLAVPRSHAENEQMKLIALTKHTPGDWAMVWLGVEEVSHMHWVGADGCGTAITEQPHPYWASDQPDHGHEPGIIELAVAYMPPNSLYLPGWHTVSYDDAPHWPLCQLALCYRPDCQ